MSSPSPSPPPADDVPDDPAELQRQIRQLTALRNERLAELLTLRSTSTLKDILLAQPAPAPDSIPIDDANLNHLLLKRSADLAADREQWTAEALRRLTGLTSFHVRDPGSGDALVGVRIEVMADGKFGTPFYLFLKKLASPESVREAAREPAPEPLLDTDHVVIHRHTIPAFFGPALAALVDKHLPPPPQPQNLDRLVRDLRRILVLHHERRSHLAHVAQAVAAQLKDTPRDGIALSDFTVDPEARLVEVEWSDSANPAIKRIGWLAISEEGAPEGVVVKQNGRRILHMESQIKGSDFLRAGPSLDSMDWIRPSLLTRLRWSDSGSPV